MDSFMSPIERLSDGNAKFKQSLLYTALLKDLRLSL